MNQTIRVLIVDDHLVVREGLRLILETGEGIELVGDAADGASAIRMVSEVQPDVVLMDLRMPGMDGIEAIERIRSEWPRIAIVILTTYNEDGLMIRGLRAGACGYLLKDTDRETLFNAIHTVARGETFLPPAIMTRLLSHTVYDEARSLSTNSRSGSELSEREREVLSRVALGERSKEIAIHLGISERTVKAHLASIYTKLDVDSRASAVAVAIERGILPQQRNTIRGSS
jgi:NarL family two-component system response regulator YdfI